LERTADVMENFTKFSKKSFLERTIVNLSWRGILFGAKWEGKSLRKSQNTDRERRKLSLRIWKVGTSPKETTQKKMKYTQEGVRGQNGRSTSEKKRHLTSRLEGRKVSLKREGNL